MTPDTHHPLAQPGLPQCSDRHPDPPEVIRHWLATAHPIPSRAYAEWTEQGVALLPLGRRFNAIRIPGDLVHAATGSDQPERVAETVRDALDGPVIHDHLTTGPTYYALVPYSRGIPWLGANDTPLLGPDTYLGIPALEHTTPPGTFWVTPPRHRGDLCAHGSVFDLILTGRRHLRAATSNNANTPPPEQL
ncbi:hypothetical protein OHB14_62005 [Streptomyces sp. NBC_01613]|uniref:hypothetical protein n=1 Tax=Streptomyces sp. NBC_01613 TaxID=2975896 RepID=UPI003870C9A0